MLSTLLTGILRRPVPVLIMIVVLVTFGALSLNRIPVEIRPQREFPGIQITATWGSQPPETIQRVLTMPLEEIAVQIPGVRNTTSTSGLGLTRITLEFPPKMELKYAFTLLQERVAQLRTGLPSAVVISVEPLASDGEEVTDRQKSFITLELSGPVDLHVLRRFADDLLLPVIKGMNGVSDVDIFGGSAVRLRIDLHEDKIHNLGLKVGMIAQSLRENIQRKGLGESFSGNENSMLVFTNLPNLPQDLAAFPLTPENPWRLGDVATISLDYEKSSTLARHNFHPLISIEIQKAPGFNALAFSRAIHDQVEQLKERLPANFLLRITSDNADLLRQELYNLLIRAAVILSVVFLILYVLFRRFSMSLLILLVIILSLAGAAVLLHVTGYTINVVTLAGLALVFGMLVDNAVVVLENIQRRARSGEPSFEAALQGTLEMVSPLAGSTATTLLVFFSLLLLENRLGETYRPLAFALGFALLASLILAVTVIPVCYVQLSGRGRTSLPVLKQYQFQSLRDWYLSFVGWNIRHRHLVYLLVLILAVGSGWLFINNVDKGGWFQWDSREEINVWVDAPRGVTLEVLDDIARSFEQRIQRDEMPVQVMTRVHLDDAYAHIRITFPDSLVNSVKPFLLKEKLVSQAVNFAGVGISISGFGLPFWNGGYRVSTIYNTRLVVTGPEYDQLWEVCRSILELAYQSHRVKEGTVAPSARSLWSTDLKQLTLEARLTSIWDAGWTYRDMMSQLQLWVNREILLDEIPVGGDRLRLWVTAGSSPPRLESVQQAILVAPDGQRNRLDNLFDLRKASVPLWIDKKNQQYAFTVAWQFRGPEQMRSRHERSIVKNLQLPPGYKLEQRQWSFLTREEESNLLRLTALVMLGIYMILAALYESLRRPFVIFFSVPFALVGVGYAYGIFHRNFDVNGYIGVLLLTGLVVNNAILLVDCIGRLQKQGMSPAAAARQAAVQRIRPILITTLTTIGGLIPLLFMQVDSSALSGILRELSFITIGGMLGSTILTITLIPLIHVSVENGIQWWSSLHHEETGVTS